MQTGVTLADRTRFCAKPVAVGGANVVPLRAGA
jgi:hypothetical protein